jgi:tetratricopeptide (TPR) repeat protein
LSSRAFCLLVAIAVAGVARGQQRYELKTETPPPAESGNQVRVRPLWQLEAEVDLRAIHAEKEPTGRIPLLEKFTSKYPQHPGLGWAYEQLQIACERAGEKAKVLAAAEKLLALDGKDVLAARRAWEAAKASDEPVLRAWALRLRVFGDEALAADTENTLYARVAAVKEPADQLRAAEELLAVLPDTRYRVDLLKIRLAARQQMGDSSKTVQAAERLLEAEPGNEDALALAAQLHIELRSEPGKPAGYATRLLEHVRAARRPDSVPVAEWEKRQARLKGVAHLVLGNVALSATQFAAADEHLRIALPLLADNGPMSAALLFYLGWANYNLEHFELAAGFFRQCLAIQGQGQYQAQALKNLDAMRRDRRIRD